MRRPWILDTDTKGTGAEIRPLRDKTQKPLKGPRILVPSKRSRREAPAAPKRPQRFKVVDVLSRQVLAEGADTKTVVELLREVRSAVDIDIYVAEQPGGMWRRLSFAERQLLLNLRARLTDKAGR